MAAKTQFSRYGNDKFDDLVQQHCQFIAKLCHQHLPLAAGWSLILGGSYGRGEGGVLAKADDCNATDNCNATADAQPEYVPYNDYDFVLIHQNIGHKKRKELNRSLTHIHHLASQYCGVHVDITPLSHRKMQRLPPALTWYELAAGHHVVAGHSDVLAAIKNRTLADVDSAEWGRLLVNRSCGILFAKWRLQGSCDYFDDEEMFDFCRRQIDKAWLALGDTWLFEQGHYHHLLAEREKRRLTGRRRPRHTCMD